MLENKKQIVFLKGGTKTYKNPSWTRYFLLGNFTFVINALTLPLPLLAIIISSFFLPLIKANIIDLRTILILLIIPVFIIIIPLSFYYLLVFRSRSREVQVITAALKDKGFVIKNSKNSFWFNYFDIKAAFDHDLNIRIKSSEHLFNLFYKRLFTYSTTIHFKTEPDLSKITDQMLLWPMPELSAEHTFLKRVEFIIHQLFIIKQLKIVQKGAAAVLIKYSTRKYIPIDLMLQSFVIVKEVLQDGQ